MSKEIKLPNNLKLRIAENKSVLNGVFAQVQRLFERPLLLHFTDHSVKHSERIIKHISKLLEGLGKALSEDERMILLSAALLHDVGMQTAHYIEGYDPEKILDTSRLDEIRENHHEFSAKFILESVKLSRGERYYLGLEAKEDLVDFIADVAKHHRKCDITLLNDPTIDGEPIRLKLLAAILRLGDCLDLDYRRVYIDTLLPMPIPTSSKLFWYCHYYVQSISITKEKIEIYFRFPNEYRSNSEYRQTVIDYIRTEVVQQMNEVYNILDSYGLRLHKDIDYHVNYSATLKPMSNDVEMQIKEKSERLKTRLVDYTVMDDLPKVSDRINKELNEMFDKYSLESFAMSSTLVLIKASVHTSVFEDLESFKEKGSSAHATLDSIWHSEPFEAVRRYRYANAIYCLIDKIPDDYRLQIVREISDETKAHTNIDIHPLAQIGDRFVIVHGANSLIGERCKIGNNCTILNDVTVGSATDLRDEHPTIEDNVKIYSGAKILGNIQIGSNCEIGMGCIVTETMPPDSKISIVNQLQIQRGNADERVYIYGVVPVSPKSVKIIGEAFLGLRSLQIDVINKEFATINGVITTNYRISDNEIEFDIQGESNFNDVWLRIRYNGGSFVLTKCMALLKLDLYKGGSKDGK